MKLGYKLMSEEHGPTALVENAVKAEEAGFDFAAISDHFSPWLDEQGHSPFAWSVLGAIASRTRTLGLMTAVTCPTMRYHPAVIAQAAATLSLLSNGRFTLGLGSGERLNEHVIGAGWPGIPERQERLAEAIDIIRRLQTGEPARYRGEYYQLDHARLFDPPKARLPIIGAAAGPVAAKLAAEKCDGLLATAPDAEIVKAYVEAGGSGPRYAEIALCYASSAEEARETAHRYFRWSLTGWPVQPELPSTEAFAAAAKQITPEAVAQAITCGPSPDLHETAIRKYIEAGFDHLILVQIGPAQAEFCEFFASELSLRLRR